MRSTSSEFIPLVALVATMVLLTAAACGGSDGETRAAREAAAERAAESGTPAPAFGTPVQPPDEPLPGAIESAARTLLAGELGVDEGDLGLESSEGVGWSDTSLGCPQEGMAYAQVITPGYRLVFDLGGAPYAVHANSDGSHMVICDDGQ